MFTQIALRGRKGFFFLLISVFTPCMSTERKLQNNQVNELTFLEVT